MAQVLRAGLAKVGSRGELVDTLRAMNHQPGGRGPDMESDGRAAGLGTYMLECNEAFRSGHGNGVSWDIDDTGVDAIKILNVRGGGKAPVCQFYLDGTDSRFVLLHTSEGATAAKGAIENLVGCHGHKFDSAWFFSGMAKRWTRGTDQRIEELMSGAGYLPIAPGISIQDHLHAVEGYRNHYAKTVARIERQFLGTKYDGHEKVLTGNPIIIEFPRVEKLERFIDGLFNASSPFKLWGTKIKNDDDYYTVPGVDLHAGSAMNFDISRDMMRVYMYNGSCGNTLLRILANLQTRYDMRTSCGDVTEWNE